MDQPISPTVTHRKRRIAIASVLLATGLFGAAAWGINRVVRPSLSLSDVMVAEVRRGDIANTINASGVAIPEHEEVVSSQVQTRVAKVRARPGQKVAAGELLLELDDHAILLAIDGLKEQLAQQENKVLALTIEMNQKHKELTSAIELLELDLQATEVKFQRFTTLRKSGAVSGEDMLTAELNVKRTQIQLRQKKELIEDTRRATHTAIEGAKLQKAILAKQLEQQHMLLAQTKVRAPFAGMLTSVLSEEGTSVMPGQMVAKVSDLNNYKVEASVSDFNARNLAPGQAVRVEQGNVVLAGTVQTILPEIQNGSIKLLIKLEQPSHPMLRNKLRVEANIVTEQKTGALVANSGPAFNGKGRQPVFVIRGGTAYKTMLDLGAADGKAVEIRAGAALGERLIISDTKRFHDIDTIRISN
jgi:HlyD family secretion protein